MLSSNSMLKKHLKLNFLWKFIATYFYQHYDGKLELVENGK